MSIEVILIAIIVGLIVYHIGMIRSHRQGHRLWRQIALENSKRCEELADGALRVNLQKEGLAKIIVAQNKQLVRLAKQCKHGDVTATEDGGKCNACGVILTFDQASENWAPARIIK